MHERPDEELLDGSLHLGDGHERVLGAPEEDLVRRLMSDRANYISNLIDIGNGARLKRAAT